MVLKDIMAISGEPGLFKFLAQGKNAIIVEHLETKKRSSAYGSARVSSLEDIAIFTDKEDMPLGKVFDIIYDKTNGGAAPDHKSDPAKLMTWFGDILPDYSRSKVYGSDIKKVVQWYNILHNLGLLVKEEPKEEEKAAETSPEAVKDTEAVVEKEREKEKSPEKKEKKQRKQAPKKE